MSDQENQQEQTPSLSSLMKKRKHNELVVIEYELNEIVNKKIQKLQKKEKTLLSVSDLHEEVKESDGLFVAGLSASVGSHMKNAALRHQPKFKLLDTDNQSIVSLGLNSIIDLSFDHPEAQSTLFTASQWKELKKLFPPKKYQIEKHDGVKKQLRPIIASYQDNRSWGPNWLSMYRKTKSLQNQFDIEENQDYDKEDFCLFFVELVLKLVKHHRYLFQEGIDVSEWDYICKLWSPVMEKLFAQSGLRLKWGDTKLSLNDIGPKNNLKVDLRILNDETIQFVNHETDSGVLEAAKSDPGPSKYQSDHCKLMVECKSIIDMYINKGHNLDTVDCIQICGLEILILNLSLSAPGVYVANEIYHGSILDSLSQMDRMLDIALNLLSFKTTVIEIKNKYVQQKSVVENSKRSVKSKKYNKALKKKPLKADKKTWTRGTWVAFRDGKTEIPPPPSKLTA